MSHEAAYPAGRPAGPTLTQKESRMKPTVIACAAIAALSLAAAVLVAGPLAPPAGPVASSYKTLSEVEPRIPIGDTTTPGDADSLFRITQPGSYYLTGNITEVTGESGIEIASNRVTIDLNGFSLIGVTGSLAGITTDGLGRSGITIRNGGISLWGSRGISISGNTAAISLENLSVTSNGDDGILASNAVLRNCTLISNVGDGVSGAAVVVGSFARGNDRIGFQLNNGGTISDSTALDNGIYGISVGAGGTVVNCSARGNTTVGIILFGDGVIKNSSSSNNLGDGINGQNGTAIIDCVANNNGQDGIVVLANSLVRGNTCANNTSDGIFVSSGSGNRIEGNTLNFNGRGLNVAGFSNIIVRNSARGNTTVDWLIAANNIYGPIIDRQIPAPVVSTPVVNGTAAASTLGSTDPNANITY